MKHDVVLINPPQANSLDDHLDPPLGLLYLASNLEMNNIDVRIADLSSRPEKEWSELIGESDIFGITVFSASYNVSKKIAGMAKKQNPGAIVIAGGPHATSMPEQTTSFPEFDSALKGEGESEFVNMVRDFRSGQTLPKIVPAKRLENLDDFPDPARHLVDIRGYHRTVEGTPSTSMITSRGCPYSCNFCCKDIHGTKIRFRSVERVVREVEQVKNNYGIDSFLFYDDVFAINIHGRLKELTDHFKKLDIHFRCNGRVGMTKPEDYAMLKEAGCDEIAFGIESGSQRMLNIFDKGVTVGQNSLALKQAKEAGLKTKAYLMTGFPGETQESIDETKRFIEMADPDKFTVFAFVPLPGCDVWKHPGRYGVTHLSQDWDQYFNIAGQYEGGVTFDTKNLSRAEFRRLHDELVRYVMQKGQRGSLEKYYESVSLEKK